ncbi:MAG: META domain-containing protein [Actinomycetota bacterium]|nr:META domain-containing protein [Actinomycetota bacterium]
MPENWIDEHAGDETVARPGFRAELRADLAAQIGSPAPARAARNRFVWRATAWSTAAAVLVVGVVLVVNRGDNQHVTSSSTTSSGASSTSSTPTTAPDGVPVDLRTQLVDVTWQVLTVDGQDTTSAATFTLQSDGRLVGFDGCNEYGYDASQPGGWTLDGDTISLDQNLVSTAILCVDAPDAIIPISDGARLRLDAATGILTITSPDGEVYTAADATTLPEVITATEVAIVPDLSAAPNRTVLYRAEVGSAADQLGRDTCSECDPARPWSPLLTDGGVVIIPDTVNARWVVVDDGVVTTVPLTASIVGQPLLIGDTIYVPQTEPGSTDARIVFYSLWYLQSYSSGYQQPMDGVDIPDQVFTSLYLNGDTIEANGRPVVTVAPAYVGATVTYALNRQPEELTTSYKARVYRWTLPAGWWGTAIGTISDGSVVFSAGDGTADMIIRVLPDGTYATEPMAHPGDGYNSGGTVSTMGYVRLELVDGQYEVARYALPQPDSWRLTSINGAVAGFGIGPQQPDEVIAAISAHFGAPTMDTGWATLVDPNDPSRSGGCPYGRVERIVRWGDLTVRFVQHQGGALLWAWSVGDLGAGGHPSQADTGIPPGMTPSGLWLDDDIHLGSTLAEVQAAWPDLDLGDIQPDGSTTGTATIGFEVILVTIDDGIVTGFGVTFSFC